LRHGKKLGILVIKELAVYYLKTASNSCGERDKNTKLEVNCTIIHKIICLLQKMCYKGVKYAK